MERVSGLVESALQAVKDGRVVTDGGSPSGKDRKKVREVCVCVCAYFLCVSIYINVCMYT